MSSSGITSKTNFSSSVIPSLWLKYHPSKIYPVFDGEVGSDIAAPTSATILSTVVPPKDLNVIVLFITLVFPTGISKYARELLIVNKSFGSP